MSRTEMLRVRVSVDELSQIDQHARDHGLKRAEYIRDAALRVLDDDPLIVIEKPAELVEAPIARRRRRPDFGRIGRIFRGLPGRRAA